MSTDVKAAASALGDRRRRRERSLAIFAGVVVVLGVVLAAALVSGARLSSGTVGLLVAAAALLMCLRALYRLATALTRPVIEIALEQEAFLDAASQRELREEKRRLVRAINELTFDHEMGKLSAADYEAVKERYQLQAVEVMRALQDDRDLHPELAAVLRRLEGKDAAEAEAAADGEGEADVPASAGAEAEAEAEAARPETDDREPERAGPAAPVAGRACASCETVNDVDARFCKQCGVALKDEVA